MDLDNEIIRWNKLFFLRAENLNKCNIIIMHMEYNYIKIIMIFIVC